ncbi:MAG: metal-dependent transcriptional regulator [Anaerovoracaceae bacterium]
MKIQESAENYLETILILSQTGNPIRSIDIVNELGFSKPSVSVAMKKLRENGYINMDDDGHITLLAAGREIAERIYERHTLLSQLLIRLGVDETTAVEDACRIEHVISPETFQKIKEHAAAFASAPDGQQQTDSSHR